MGGGQVRVSLVSLCVCSPFGNLLQPPEVSVGHSNLPGPHPDSLLGRIAPLFFSAPGYHRLRASPKSIIVSKMPVSNRRISMLVFDAKSPLLRLRLRKVDTEELSKVVSSFREIFDKDSHRYRALIARLIMNAKTMRIAHSRDTIQAVKGLLSGILFRLGGGTGTRPIKSCRRDQWSRKCLPLHPGAQVNILTRESGNFEKRRKHIVKKVQRGSKVCQLLREGVWKASQISRMAGVPRWRVYQLRSARENQQEGFQRSLKTLERQTAALMGVSEVLQDRNFAVDSGVEILEELRQQKPGLGLSRLRLYWALRATGLRLKKVVERCPSNSELLESRITFFQNWTRCGNDRRFFFVFFDWTSFCEGNFKQMAWSLRGKKSIVGRRYVYTGLHLLAVMSEIRIEGYQLAQGNLSTDLVFNFLTGCIAHILERLSTDGRRLVVVLDNSPLNFGEALRHFCLLHQVTLMYTAPRSSFQNPIEMLFAMIKAPLKRVFSASKFA